ncbi:MAG: hypothetical protein JSW00_08830 [Thermoplasmata archaeon]|nr:MAG: hypothetical protein JSW00_08830 [Thermoplasmata archaeon]
MKMEVTGLLLHSTQVEEKLNRLHVWMEEEIRSVHNRIETLENRVRTLEGEVRTLKMKK